MDPGLANVVPYKGGFQQPIKFAVTLIAIKVSLYTAMTSATTVEGYNTEEIQQFRGIPFDENCNLLVPY